MPVKQEPFDVGETVTVTVTFFDVNDAPADPSTVTLKYVKPQSGAEVTVAQGALTHVALGVWTYGIAVDEPGTWQVRGIGTGTVPIVVPHSFGVRKKATGFA